MYGYLVQTCDIPVLFLLVHYIQSSEAIHCRNSAHYIHLPRSLSLHLLLQALLQFDHLSLISKSNRQLNVNIVMYSKVKRRKLLLLQKLAIFFFPTNLKIHFVPRYVSYTQSRWSCNITQTLHIRHINLYWPIKGKNVTT